MKARRCFTAEFKAQVALEGIRGNQRMSDLAVRYELHPNMIMTWKRQAIENMATKSMKPAGTDGKVDEDKIRDLHAKIGQFNVERVFFAKAFERSR